MKKEASTLSPWASLLSPKMRPITSLRDTNKLEEDLKESGGILHITKNGYENFVILSPEVYGALTGSLRVELSNNPVAKHEEKGWLPAKPQDDPLGFVRAASATITQHLGNPKKNAAEIVGKVRKLASEGAHLLVLPELCLTGYTLGDLFRNQKLLDDAESSITWILQETAQIPMVFAFGCPIRKENNLYNCAILAYRGKILGIVPKTHIPNYSEFYEARHFSGWMGPNDNVSVAGQSVPFGNKFLFRDVSYLPFTIGIEICEDLWAPLPPSTNLAKAGATVLLNLSASNEVVGKAEYRKKLCVMASARLLSAYVYSDAGDGESTTDLVFAGHNMICENGHMLSESPLFSMKDAIADLDMEKLLAERMRLTTFDNATVGDYEVIPFDLPIRRPNKLLRHYNPNPFIPERPDIDLARVETILSLQAMGLKKRMETVHQKKVLVGLSGGLDSTLALLVAVEAFDRLGYPRKDIKAVTLPAFGTSQRTHDNALLLSKELGVSFEEINLKESLLKHFEDIHHDPNNKNVTYENAQARERTQVLMDLANDEGSLMLGTGDLSELCLGWTTYNGDHMSMYGVNASIPKTLVRYLTKGYALLHPETAKSLNDIIETPISPELLPPSASGMIEQQTEDVVGPYEVVDFIAYHFLRYQYRPKKLFFLLGQVYGEKYPLEKLKGWLRSFLLRFFRNQFKRSCLPDGPKVGTVSISPRGDWRMPSDADGEVYLAEMDAIDCATFFD